VTSITLLFCALIIIATSVSAKWFPTSYEVYGAESNNIQNSLTREGLHEARYQPRHVHLAYGSKSIHIQKGSAGYRDFETHL